MESWRKHLDAGHVDAAWTEFIERYHRLIDATIRRSLPEHDDALDAVAHACEQLSSGDLARLRKFSERSIDGAKFTTWLVVVVRNLTLDFIRERDGRPRAMPPSDLSEIRQRIYQLVLLDHNSHIESYEQLLTQGERLRFGEFLRHLTEVYRAVDSRRRAVVVRRCRVVMVPIDDMIPSDADQEADEERCDSVGRAMSALATDERRAVELFVMEGKSAAEIADTIGWTSAKTVYDRVRRALSKLRAAVQREELSSGVAYIVKTGELR